MKIAVLSGKGGTGKTLVSVNLAVVAGDSTYVDCDVEEPNGHLFLKPAIDFEERVVTRIPQADAVLCNGCRKCVEFCKFNAMAYIKNRLLIFEEICHSCGGCVLVCPEKALIETERAIGSVSSGASENVTVYTGIMNTGEASGVPIIQQLLKMSNEEEGITIIDCPPGSACIVMESIKDADYCMLVAEPTLFGAHNLEMVHELVSLFDKPCGVVLNKCLPGKNPSEEFCLNNNVDILAKIPFDHHLGKLNSDGKIAVIADKKYRDTFSDLLKKTLGIVSKLQQAKSNLEVKI